MATGRRSKMFPNGKFYFPVLLALLLLSCSPQATPTPIPTLEPTATRLPTATPLSTATPTPEPRAELRTVQVPRSGDSELVMSVLAGERVEGEYQVMPQNRLADTTVEAKVIDSYGNTIQTMGERTSGRFAFVAASGGHYSLRFHRGGRYGTTVMVQYIIYWR